MPVDTAGEGFLDVGDLRLTQLKGDCIGQWRVGSSLVPHVVLEIRIRLLLAMASWSVTLTSVAHLGLDAAAIVHGKCQ